ncbi:MAG: cbb3-type cytochrome oxidase assembly protein CcoS [Proteobacteria bacterium]|jgi:cbb3-type cytochrome oxidase maturation protein|nr:cbb3-type cytochrome oxidase assembly protein CcoS [Pseudomonadota bacterium]MBK9252167.1 cbb3-type cytochrome oxidase assembly protein CcoS [Pseudomonadota bacterium]MCC6633631.1 cbb3-type cytochrome oxidase assembly protein CcoS [Gammaproteobacteria bacterium]
MNILLLLVPLSLMLLLVIIGAFVWAVRNGQFDDLDTPPLDVLSDRQPEVPPDVTDEAGPDER